MMDLSFAIDVDTSAARERVAQLREINDDLNVVAQMIRESGPMWLETRDRSETGNGPIIVTESPDRAIYLERRDNYQGELLHMDGWVVVRQPLFTNDAASFYAAFGSEWPWLLRAQVEVNGKPHKVRAFIKNGRSEGWTLSLNMRTDAK